MKRLKPGMTTAEAGMDVVEKVIQETALAYYHANPNTQYNVAASLTVCGVQGPLIPEGPLTLTGGMQPEQTSPDYNYYGVCRSFTADVFYDAFRMELPGLNGCWFGENMIKYPECLVYRYGEARPEFLTPDAYHPKDKGDFLRALKKGMRPGDTILANPNDGNSGHVILFVGDCLGNGTDYVLHCWPIGGGRWDPETGVNKREPFGAIVLQTAEEFLFTEGSSPNWSLAADRMVQIYVFRFTLAKDFGTYRFTDAAVTRYNRPGLIVRKDCNFGFYDTVLPGETVKFTERFVNKSSEDYELSVREFVPAGTKLLEAEGAETGAGNALTWRVMVPAFDYAEITYSMTVEAEPGTEVLFPCGSADTMPTRAHRFKVGQSRFTEEERLKLTSLAMHIPGEYRNGGFQDLRFVKNLYKDLFNRTPELPDTLQELLEGMYEVQKPSPDFPELLVPKKALSERAKIWEKYSLPRFTLGKYVMIPEDRVENRERAIDILESYFEPGDVMAVMRGENKLDAKKPEEIEILLYIGRGIVISHSAEGTKHKHFEDTIAVVTKDHFAKALRPLYFA
ncbi:MAG: hypothetical protein J5794_01970 [Lachnospiraceae bacterium]|nr:hypothetical protein [Lachnospiraceae bacterium]